MDNVEIWQEFENAKNKLFKFTNGKRIVLCGYGYSGWFVEHLFRRENKQIEYIVDDGDLHRKLKLYNSFIIKNLDKDTTAVILTFKHDEQGEALLKEAGYIPNVHYMYARDVFYDNNDKRPLSYYNWLEERYGLDINKSVSLDDLEKSNGDTAQYSVGIDYSVSEVLDKFSFTNKDCVFDFGCGKGGALILFHKYGVCHLGGVEYDQKLYKTICSNFDALGIDKGGIIHGDAAKITEALDGYNYFYMYNPFGGETFRTVIKNIERSFDRNPRRVTLIYAGAWLHNDVVANGRFKLAKEIYTDAWCRYVNVYTITE